MIRSGRSAYQFPRCERDRPWYTTKVTPTFPDMLGALRFSGNARFTTVRQTARIP